MFVLCGSACGFTSRIVFDYGHELILVDCGSVLIVDRGDFARHAHYVTDPVQACGYILYFHGSIF